MIDAQISPGPDTFRYSTGSYHNDSIMRERLFATYPATMLTRTTRS